MTTVSGNAAPGPLYIPSGEGAVVRMTKIQFINLPKKEQDKIQSVPGNKRTLSRWGLWDASRSKITQKMQPSVVEEITTPSKSLKNRGSKKVPRQSAKYNQIAVELPLSEKTSKDKQPKLSGLIKHIKNP